MKRIDRVPILTSKNNFFIPIYNSLGNKSGSGVRLLNEVTMTDPIRYSANDPIEKWLYDLLCLNVYSV